MTITLILQCLTSLELALEKFESQTKILASSLHAVKDIRFLNETVSKGIDLHHLARKTNSVFGALVVTESAFMLIMASCSIFFSTAIFEAFGRNGFSSPRFLTSVGFALYAACSLYKLWLLQRNGQRLSSLYQVRHY